MAAVLAHHSNDKNSNSNNSAHRSQQLLLPQQSPPPQQQHSLFQQASPPPSPAKRTSYHQQQQQQQQQQQTPRELQKDEHCSSNCHPKKPPLTQLQKQQQEQQAQQQQQQNHRRDTLAIKQELCRELGAHADVYWRKLRDFLNGKCDRLDFDRLASRLLIKRKVTLHNRLIMAILHNVYKNSAPPPPPPPLLPGPPVPDPQLSQAVPPLPPSFSSSSSSSVFPSAPTPAPSLITDSAHDVLPVEFRTALHEHAASIQRKRKAEAALPDWRVKLRRREVMSFSSASRQRIVNLVPKRMLHAPNPTPTPEPISPPLHAHLQTQNFFSTTGGYNTTGTETTTSASSGPPQPSQLPALAFETRLLPSQDNIRQIVQLIASSGTTTTGDEVLPALPEGCEQPEECAKLVDRALQAYMMNMLTGILRVTTARRRKDRRKRPTPGEKKEKKVGGGRKDEDHHEHKLGDRHKVGVHGSTTRGGGAAARHADEKHGAPHAEPDKSHHGAGVNAADAGADDDDEDDVDVDEDGAKVIKYVGLSDCLFAASLHPSWFTRAHWLVEEATAMLDEFEGTIEDTVGDIRRHR
ncbi:transcriptional regulator of RNA polII, SAGA, subunit-domain-containing protein [Geranomyces variabilis]|nr:transcriptional regulator of RNA polII, SAGA, subunit-domain-containing protein [Geranomyces variabilis]